MMRMGVGISFGLIVLPLLNLPSYLHGMKYVWIHMFSGLLSLSYFEICVKICVPLSAIHKTFREI